MPGSGLNYWEYLMDRLNVIVVNRTVSLDPGQEKVVYEDAGKGFWMAGFICADTPRAGIRWNLDGTEVYDVIEDIYNFGFVYPNNFYFYVTRYDTTNNIYCMAWAPSYSGVYRNFARISLVNQSTSTANVRVFAYLAKVTGDKA